MHDAIQLERLGVPATTVITEPFSGLAASFAVTLGAPGYHTTAVPHPISSKDEATLRTLAGRVAGAVLVQLTGRPGVAPDPADADE